MKKTFYFGKIDFVKKGAQNRLFSTVRQIVEKTGGYREKDIFSRLHHIERTET